MTTLNKQLVKIEESLEGRLKTAVKFGTRRQFLQKQADILAKGIQRNTRLGKGVNKQRRLYRLAPLKDVTIDIRERYESNLSPLTTTSRSNLTATGQLLDAIRSRLSGNNIILFFKEQRSKTLSGGRDTSKNSDIVRGLESGNLGRAKTTPRPFFKISLPEQNKVLRALRKEVLKKFDD